jgi:hypothetical protein
MRFLSSITRVLDKEYSSFERDFLSYLKIFSKPIAKRYRREKIYQSWKKRSSKEPIPYPKLAFNSIPSQGGNHFPFPEGDHAFIGETYQQALSDDLKAIKKLLMRQK